MNNLALPLISAILIGLGATLTYDFQVLICNTNGVTFAIVFVVLVGSIWLQYPTPIPAIVFGAFTVMAPFFIMRLFGLGFAASKSSNPMQARLRSLMNHAAFGLGLYWIERREVDGNNSDIEENAGQMSSGVEILLIVAHNTLTNAKEYIH